MQATTSQIDHAANPTLSGAERRIDGRKEFQVEVGLLADYQFFTGFTQNISEGGLFIATHELMDIGTRFEVTFEIPGIAHAFNCTCEVRWLRTYDGGSLEEMQPGMGVRFVNLTEQEIGLINGYMVGRETLFHEDE